MPPWRSSSAPKRWHKAMARADADAIKAAVTDDFSWHMVGLKEFPIGQPREGGQGMVDYLTDLLDVLEVQSVNRHTYLEEGDTALSDLRRPMAGPTQIAG